MKVNDSALTNAPASRLGGAKPAEDRPGARKPETGAASRDTVQLSELSSRLAQPLESSSPERAAHLERLAALVRSGDYNPDALEISRGIIDEALSFEP
jgi:anti-sigma28 factor (negative regulator of flagellin synthesis)